MSFHGESIWATAGAVEALKELWRQGHTGNEIAKRLRKQFRKPVSRESVCGKANRLGLPSRDQSPVTYLKRPITMAGPAWSVPAGARHVSEARNEDN